MLELEHTISDIISPECTNVDQVIVDSLVEIVTKFYWTLHLSRKCFSPLNRETKLLER